MLGHASLEQTSTYLNVQRGGLRDSMRKSDALAQRCNSVAISTKPAPPIAENEDEAIAPKVRVN
jgi:hypothetical protein